jgi:hypothetical protein
MPTMRKDSQAASQAQEKKKSYKLQINMTLRYSNKNHILLLIYY